MTAQQIAAPLSRLPLSRLPLSRLWHGVGHRLQEWSTRRELAQLDDRMLKDLGISRAQAAFEADRRRGLWPIGPHHDA